MRVLIARTSPGAPERVLPRRDFLLALFLFLFIFTILGMQLFGGSDGFAGERKNFDSFWNSFLIVFEVLTASDWQKVMWRAMRGTGASASAFFVAWIFVGHFIFLDLLLAILTFNFSRETEDERLEREEREHLETETTGGEKRGLDKTAGGEVVMDRMIRRKNRKFADQADAMRRWPARRTRCTGTTQSRTRTRTMMRQRRSGFDAKRASWKSWRTSTTTTRQRDG